MADLYGAVVLFEATADGALVAATIQGETGRSLVALDPFGKVVAECGQRFAHGQGLHWRPGHRHLSLTDGGEVLLWDLDGGQLHSLTEGKFGHASFHTWSPDGARLCFMAFDPTDGLPPRLWMRDDRGASALPRDPNWPNFKPEWSPDGGLIAFRRGAAKNAEGNAGIWVVAPEGDSLRQIVHRPDCMEWTDAGAWSPSGDQLAFGRVCGNDRVAGIWDRRSDSCRLLAGPDPVTSCPVWSPDGRALLHIAADTGTPTIYDLLTGRNAPLGDFPGEVPCRSCRWSPAPDPLAADAAGSFWRYGESGWLCLVEGTRVRLPKPQWIEYKSTDGVRVPAAVWRGSANSPWVVWVRGGPGGEVDLDSPSLAALLRAGFSVLQPDYRGCGGRGRAWAEANRRDYGGQDAADVSAAALYLTKELGVGRAFIGISGYSYGGFLSLTALVRTPDLFAAGALLWPLLELADLPALAGADFTLAEWREFSQQRSPLARLDRVHCPLLSLHGELDTFSVPAKISRIREGTPSADVQVFVGDTHGLYRHEAEVCQRLVGFFRGHLRAPGPGIWAPDQR